MIKKKLIYLALGSLFVLPSCSQDEPSKIEHPGDGNRIYFRSYLPAVTQTRAGVVSSDNFNTCQVTCFNPDNAELVDTLSGALTPYFNDVCFQKDASGRFLSQGDNKCIWPDAQSKLHFFAYYPSADSLKKASGSGFFNFVNASRLTEGKAVLDYRIEKFHVSTEIAAQVDFLTAYASGSLVENADKGIELDFKHQLTRVELSAWGANEKYDFEIAGVRIGNPLVEGDLNLSALSTSASPWLNTEGHQASVEHIFSTGEEIVVLSKSAASHASENEAASVMGTAGPAMVIPMSKRIEAWEGKKDPAIEAIPYSTDKMYFSILLRVKNKENEVAYPYPNDRDNMTVIYLAVDKDGKVTKRLYKIDDTYYTTSEKSDAAKYTPTATEEIRGFGWAALPVAAKWEAGKIYTYKLNYSDGIGWHDPDDPKPGDPILERGKIPFDVTINEWTPAQDYDSDLNVPKR